jgi:filamentous hemagglutinin family protein
MKNSMNTLRHAALVAACFSGTVLANPSGPVVVNGQVTFAQQGNVYTITNSPNAIINWNSFSIQSGETTSFLQQSSTSAVLNRITGQDPSQILGALQSNGRVYLINPNGILFGNNAQVNVNGLVASSLAITDADFLAGKNRFSAGTIAGKVSNQGAITTPSGGQVLLIAPQVENSGIITSPQGDVMLAAGHTVQLADSTNPDLQVVVAASNDQAINLGKVIAQSGTIGIYGALVNQRGVLNADSAIVGKNGKIVLQASRTTLLEAGSTTTATGAGVGGEIDLLGTQVALTGDARVDASGQNGGGTVLVGGDYQGKNAAVMNAQRVYVGADVRISADAIERGNGGKVIVWSNETTQAYGSISVRGGAQQGDGGFVETSGHYLDVAGIRVHASAPHGKTGTWLLDPYDIRVSPGDDSGPLTFEGASPQYGNVSYVNPITINRAEANVTLQAQHDITLDSELNISAYGVGLTAQAGNNIDVLGSITLNGGALLLSANDNGGGTASGVGKVNLGDVVLHTNGGVTTLKDSTTQSSTPIPKPIPTPNPNPMPTADICAIAPNSALCQILSPPTASEPVKPVQQASNEVIKTVATAVPKTNFDEVAFLNTKKTDSGASSSSGTTSSGTDVKKADEKTADSKDLASNDKSGIKNEPVKKLYCN